MIDKDILLYKIKIIIEYLKKHNGYNHKLYNNLYDGIEEPDSNIVEYAEDIEYIIKMLIEKLES